MNIQITRAYVYSFSDCIELCASNNLLNSNTECNVVIYTPDDPRPSNCWVGGAQDINASSLTELDGSDVAILNVDS